MEIKQLHKEDNELLIGFAESRIGGRGENQDSFGSCQTSHGFLVTVCDGMGGGPGGLTASTIAVREIIAGVEEANDDETTSNIIIKAIRRANMAIIEAENDTPSLKGMGSTATVLLINEKAAYVAYVGDSRVYQFRGHKKIFRTFDHSMVFDLVKQGVITEEQARLSAQSNIIMRALGIQPDVEVDITELPYEKGDRFMLCTDGIHGALPESELIKLATSRKNVLGALTDDIATLIDNEGRMGGGGHDNLTLAIVEMKSNSLIRPIMSQTTKLTLLALAVICAISIILNIRQCSGRQDSTSDTVQVDTIKWHQKDSVQQATINRLNDSIGTLNQKLNQIKETIK